MSYTAELTSVTKTYSAIVALDNVSLKIVNGEILALLGPNGSGKTTLLKILAFIEKPSKGEVHFEGVKVTNSNVFEVRMESTMVFQKTVLFSTTVYNNVAYGLKMRRFPKDRIKREVREALSLVHLEGYEERQTRKLSGGEQQRVALARALVLKTKLLLLDEPTSNLDPKNASIIEEVIAAVNRESKTTIVIATHNMFQAKSLPTRIALMKDGRITEVGTPAEIFGRLSKTLRSFTASENNFTGTASATENGTTIVNIGKDIQIETTAQQFGTVSIFVSPQDIILSRQHFDSSARNNFKGRIVEISDQGSLVKLKVDVGKPFSVQITKHSFNEMGLNLNSEVFLAFKASNVQIA